jgi:hypothetical protein
MMTEEAVGETPADMDQRKTEFVAGLENLPADLNQEMMEIGVVLGVYLDVN